MLFRFHLEGVGKHRGATVRGGAQAHHVGRQADRSIEQVAGPVFQGDVDHDDRSRQPCIPTVSGRFRLCYRSGRFPAPPAAGWTSLAAGRVQAAFLFRIEDLWPVLRVLPAQTSERRSSWPASLATAQTVFSAGSPADTLKAAVDLAVETIDGCDFASVFVLDWDALTTPVGTDSVAADVDVAQHRAGEGPAFDAVGPGVGGPGVGGQGVGAQGVGGEGGRVYAEDLADDPRWVSFGPDAVKAGVRSALALRLSEDDSRGAALSLYAGYPRAFGASGSSQGRNPRGDGGPGPLRGRGPRKRGARHHPGRVTTREMIGQAQGILMEREHISARSGLRQSASRLRSTSTPRSCDVAQALLDTGPDPGTDSPPTAP